MNAGRTHELKKLTETLLCCANPPRQLPHHAYAMTSFTKEDAAKALELLADAAALRHVALDAFPTAPIHPDHDE